MIRTIATTVVMTAFLSAAANAQELEQITGEPAGKIGKLLAEGFAKLTDLPVKPKLLADKGTGVKSGERGGFVLPDENLTADALAKLDKDIVPVGVLFLRGGAPVSAASTVDAPKMFSFDVSVEDKTAAVTALPLAVGKVAGKPVLLVYGKAKEPVVVTNLDAIDESPTLPMEVEVFGLGDGRANVILKLAGKLRGAVMVVVVD